jgi:membrane protein YdbS with pleckstrin-like domain
VDVDGQLQSLPTAARTRWRIQGAIVGLLVGAVPGVAIGLPLAVLLDNPRWFGVTAVLAVGAALLGPVWANRRYQRFGYLLTDQAVRVRDGVVVHSDAIAPLFRVQHVDIDRGPLQLRFGLASLTIHTAAPAADIHLPDLRAEDAEGVRDDILAGSRRAAEELGVADVDAV